MIELIEHRRMALDEVIDVMGRASIEAVVLNHHEPPSSTSRTLGTPS
jgi:hypothetical protein